MPTEDPNRSRLMCIILFSWMLFTIAQVVAPILIPQGSITDYPHEAQNIQDSSSVLTNDIVLAVYRAGDWVCHQYPERSLKINGNQMPICARCFAIYLGMSAISGVAVYFRPCGSFFAALSSILPTKLRNRSDSWLILAGIGIALAAPMIIDGGLQLYTTYKSTLATRLFTGLLFGIAEGGFIIGLISAGISAWTNLALNDEKII